MASDLKCIACRQYRSSFAQITAVRAIVICAPGREALLFLIQLVCKINVGFAIQEIAKVQARPLEMDRVDLKISPIQSSVTVVSGRSRICLADFRSAE
jgi:hypothetical protein